jgi:hypothetical protein
VDNLVSKHIHNNLPIYLLYLPDMKLVHRSSVKQLIEPAIDGIVDWYLAPQNSRRKKEEYITQMVKHETRYAIFSHRWLVEGELTFQDLSKLDSITVAGFSPLIKSSTELKELRGAAILHQAMDLSAKRDPKRNGREVFGEMKKICECMSDQSHHATDFVKLVKFCEAALRCGCDFAWLDTGCINKQSSSELEESIRSMFSWYRNSHICIVHLSETTTPYTMLKDAWFTRGWTLQELLAPKVIKFFSQSWRPLTAKRNDKISDAELGISFWKVISEITGIPEIQLLNFEPGTINVRERMVWASKRQTTRIEDMAYCLIGIFNIPLSIAYGEGQMAFHRLQVEIVQRSHDRGLFAWNGSPSSHNSMFAAGPDAFFPLEGSLITAEEEVAGSVDPTYALTNYGLRIPISIYDVQRIEALGKHGGVWITHKLEVLEFGEIKVAFNFLVEDAKLAIGILGNIPGDKSLAIVLISPETRSQRRFKRMTTKNVVKLPSSNEWKAPRVIFIE